MTSNLGLYLRQVRQSRQLSQLQAAKAAGIGRVTLNRWESGTQHPRLVELKALLKALHVTTSEADQLLQHLESSNASLPKTAHQGREIQQVNPGPRPHGGDLLRALRLRRELSQEDVALQTGVTERTVRRWEKMEVWPSTTQLHALCFALQAKSEEIAALTAGGAKLEADSSSSEQLSLEELYERCQTLHHYSGDIHAEALKDLGFLVLESQAALVASRSPGATEILRRIYSCHANYYSAHEQWAQGKVYANRALDLLPSHQVPDRGAVQAAIAFARCSTYKSARPHPGSGLEVLRHWLQFARWPDFEGWVLSDMAKYQVMMGDPSVSVALAQRALEVAANSDRPYDFYLRQLDEASILCKAGQPAQALQIVECERGSLQPEHRVQFLLLEAQASLALQNQVRAVDRLGDALQLIANFSLTHLQPHAQKLASCF